MWMANSCNVIRLALHDNESLSELATLPLCRICQTLFTLHKKYDFQNIQTAFYMGKCPLYLDNILSYSLLLFNLNCLLYLVDKYKNC